MTTTYGNDLTKLERDLIDDFNPNTLQEIADAARLRADILAKGKGKGRPAQQRLRDMADAIDDLLNWAEV